MTSCLTLSQDFVFFYLCLIHQCARVCLFLRSGFLFWLHLFCLSVRCVTIRHPCLCHPHCLSWLIDVWFAHLWRRLDQSVTDRSDVRRVTLLTILYDHTETIYILLWICCVSCYTWNWYENNDLISIQYNKSLPSISSGIPSGTLGGFANSQQVTARSVAVCWTIAVCNVVWSWSLVVGTLCLTSSRLCRWVLRRHVLLSVLIVPCPGIRCHQHVDQLCCRIDLSERNHPKVPCVVPLVFRVLIGNVLHVVGEVSAHFGIVVWLIGHPWTTRSKWIVLLLMYCCVMVIYLRNGTDTTEDCSRCSDGKLDL